MLKKGYPGRGRRSYQPPTLKGCPPTCRARTLVAKPCSKSETDMDEWLRMDDGRLGLETMATGEGVLQSSEAGDDARDDEADASAGG